MLYSLAVVVEDLAVGGEGVGGPESDEGIVADCLECLTLSDSPEDIAGNMTACYSALVARGWIAEPELALLESWLLDLRDVVGDPEPPG